jgi:hypothetical protein
MKSIYIKSIPFMIAAATLVTNAGAQTKTKTITIIDGDTTITEKELDHDIIIITENTDKDGKVSRKKTVVRDAEPREDAVAYSYRSGREEDIEIRTNNGREDKVIIRKEKGAHDRSDMEMLRAERALDKSGLNVQLNVEKDVMKLEVESSGKEPVHISLLDENGKQILYETQKDGKKYSKEMKLNKGAYFLNVIHNQNTTTDKIIIK